MNAGDIIMGKYAFTKMEEAIIKNTESVHSKGFIISLYLFYFYWKRQGGDRCEAESPAPATYIL